MIVDMQRRLLSVKEITKQLKPGSSNVDHLDQTGNQSENVHVCGLEQQSMKGVSQCMNVDEPYKPVEGISQCIILNDEYESVVVDGLISTKSFVRDDPEFKVKENEEASHSDSFLSTQQVRELMNDVFYTPSLGSNSVKDDACVSKLMDVDQPSLVKNVLDDVDIDSVVKDVEEIIQDLIGSPTTPKRTVSVLEVVMALFRDKNRMEMRWTFPWVDDGHHVQIDFWEKLVGRSHTKIGWLSSDIEYLWQFRDPNVDWEIASPYLSDMLSRFEYPLYYADGVKYGVPCLCGPPNGIETRHFWLQLREKLMFQIPLYLDNAEVFEKKNIDK
nr:hypothetical protein [Tanacetum cinerariifolium]